MRATRLYRTNALATALVALVAAGPSVAQDDSNMRGVTGPSQAGESEGGAQGERGPGSAGEGDAAMTQEEAAPTDDAPPRGADAASGAGAGSGGSGVSQSEAAPTDDDVTREDVTPGEEASTAGMDRRGENGGGAATENTESASRNGSERGRARSARDDGLRLDLERFSEDVYERGFQQGYLRGIADARRQFREQMQALRDRSSQHGGRRPGDRGRDRPRVGAGDNGPVIVLPPGMTPEAFLDRLRQDHRSR